MLVAGWGMGRPHSLLVLDSGHRSLARKNAVRALGLGRDVMLHGDTCQHGRAWLGRLQWPIRPAFSHHGRHAAAKSGLQWAGISGPLRLAHHVAHSQRCLSAAQGSSVAQSDETVGVVIVDHGSRKAESNQMLVEFVELYRQVTGRSIVEVAHMELAEPTIEQAVGSCVRQGAAKVVVAPYFLSRGRHIQQDIPALVAAAQQQLPPGVECVIAEPIGIDALMAQLIERRVAAAEQREHS